MDVLGQVDRGRADSFIEGLIERDPTYIELRKIQLDYLKGLDTKPDAYFSVLKRLVESDWSNQDYFTQIKELCKFP